MLTTIILWIGTITCFLGYYFLNRKNVKGMYVFMITNLCTLTFDIITQNYIQGLMALICIYFNIEGVIKWSKDNKKEVLINE